jgi:hypothetical protein
LPIFAAGQIVKGLIWSARDSRLKAGSSTPLRAGNRRGAAADHISRRRPDRVGRWRAFRGRSPTAGSAERRRPDGDWLELARSTPRSPLCPSFPRLPIWR